MSITLNEQQMNLLREYHEKDVEFQAAKLNQDNSEFMSAEFKQANNEYARTHNNRMLAAAVFAASVVGDLQHRGTESTEVKS